MAEADVPLKDKELSVSLAYDKVFDAGTESGLVLKARDASGSRERRGNRPRFRPLTEYYQADAGFWTDSLYPKRRSSSEGRGSLFAPNAVSMPIRTGLIRRKCSTCSAGHE